MLQHFTQIRWEASPDKKYFMARDSPVFGLLACLDRNSYISRRNCKLATHLLNSLATIHSLNIREDVKYYFEDFVR